MILALTLLAATGPIAAERAYSNLAQTSGQWTAFRATATPDALMFVPEPVKASAWLAGRQDPPVPVIWWPAASWTSCDGRLAVNYGPWIRKAGRLVGTFTTIWTSDGASWRWRLDRGDSTDKPIAAGDRPRALRASCRGSTAAGIAPLAAAPAANALVSIEGKLASPAGVDWRKAALIDAGASPDNTLRWEVRRVMGRGAASHVLIVWQWDGRVPRLVLLEATDPPQSEPE